MSKGKVEKPPYDERPDEDKLKANWVKAKKGNSGDTLLGNSGDTLLNSGNSGDTLLNSYFWNSGDTLLNSY